MNIEDIIAMVMTAIFRKLLLIILLNNAALYALDFDSDFYGGLHNLLDDLYGADENAGLTTFPVLVVPMGGHAEGMASAFAAVCDDISFIESNPAGSSSLTRTEIAFFHNNWIADTKVESAVFSTRLSRFGFAAAGKWLYTPFTEYGGWGERLSKGYYSEAVAMLNTSYTFLPGYYFLGISLGVTLKGAYRAMPNLSAYSADSQSAAAFMGDVGLLTRVNFLKWYESRDKNMSFALVLKNFGVPVKGESLPAAAVAGFAYKPFRPILFSLDMTLPLNLQDYTWSEKPNIAVASAVTLTPFLSMRTGVLLKAGGSRVTLGSSIIVGAVTIEANYTLDLATQIQPLNRVTIGVRLDLGDGGRAKIAKLVDQHYVSGLDAYSNGEDDKAMEEFNAALELNPNFDPALEGIKAIENYRQLNQRIRSMDSR